MRPDAPTLGRQRVVVEKAERLGMDRGVGSLEAGAADHHIGAMLAHIGPHTLPQQLERALVAIGLEHAGAAKLDELALGLGPEQRRDVVFALRVEPVIEIGHILAQQTIGADYLGAPPAPPIIGIAPVDHEQMVEDRVEFVLVAPREDGERAGRGRHLLVENFVAEPLRAPDLALLAGEPHLEVAEPAIDLRRLKALAEATHHESAPA